jgi:hypothetical protein
MAQPQKIIPSPINTLVTMAGVEWNWINVYRIIPATEPKLLINIIIFNEVVN